MTELPATWLIVLPLVIWLLLPGQPAPARHAAGFRPAPRSRLAGVAIDLLLMLVCGVGLSAANAGWFARISLDPQPFLCTDFHEYCGSIAGIVLGNMDDVSPQRSPLTMMLSASLAKRLGLVDGMEVAALISTAVIGASLYLWGRAILDRTAGALAAMAGTVFVPLVALSRTLSLYPEMAAVFTLGAGLTALALRTRGPLAVLGAGVAAGACLLVDARGLFWALPYLGLGLLAAVWPPPGTRGIPAITRNAVISLVALALPIIGSWILASHWLGDGQCLEVTMDPTTRMRDQGLTLNAPTRSLPPIGCYIWGKSSPLGIPTTLRWLVAMTDRIPEAAYKSFEVRRNLTLLLTPVVPVLTGATVIATLGTLRGRQRLARLAALVGTAVPFAASLNGGIRMQRGQLHYLSTPGPLLALILGLALGTLLWGLDGIPLLGSGWRRLRAALLAPLPTLRRQTLPHHVLARFVLGNVLGFLLVTGILPTVLSPAATWRVPIRHAIGDIQAVVYSHGGGALMQSSVPATPSCYELLDQQATAGIDPGGTLFGGVPREARSVEQQPPPGGW